MLSPLGAKTQQHALGVIHLLDPLLTRGDRFPALAGLHDSPGRLEPPLLAHRHGMGPVPGQFVDAFFEVGDAVLLLRVVLREGLHRLQALMRSVDTDDEGRWDRIAADDYVGPLDSLGFAQMAADVFKDIHDLMGVGDPDGVFVELTGIFEVQYAGQQQQADKPTGSEAASDRTFGES